MNRSHARRLRDVVGEALVGARMNKVVGRMLIWTVEIQDDSRCVQRAGHTEHMPTVEMWLNIVSVFGIEL